MASSIPLKVGDILTVKDKNIEILEIIPGYKRKIKFIETGYIGVYRNANIRTGEIKDPYHKSVHGVGYLGAGDYTSKNKAHPIWSAMISRCYSALSSNQSKVCDRWHNYQNFATWYNSNYVEGFEVDKDLARQWLYSPETCYFLPREINACLNTRNGERTTPLGVTMDANSGRFHSQCGGYIGSFETAEEAFQAYRPVKEAIIKSLAYKYKDKISEKAYNLLMNYEVMITD